MEAPVNLQNSRQKVLIADDEQIIRVRLKELGEKLGFEVVTAGDGVEAWEVYSVEQPDLVVLDIYMPRMNGLLVLSKIKSVRPECPVILITGFLNYEQLVNVSSVKPDGCIVKPLNMAKTSDLILRMVEKRAAVLA